MTQGMQAARQWAAPRAAGAMRRRERALSPTSSVIIAGLRPNVKTQSPPSHLTGTEVDLWLRAEAARGNGNHQKYWDLRRELLLTQAARY